MTKKYTAAEQRNIMLMVAGAFTQLRGGSNSVGDYNTLAGALNIGMVRAEQIGQEAVEVFRAALKALLRADQTYESLKVYVFTQADLVDLAKAVQGYSEILKTSTEQQMNSAIAEAERRLAVGIHARLPGSAH
jgi:hypothetical protein